MVVYSYGQVRTTTVFSQELLAVTVKLATREREKGRREGGEGEKRGREATISVGSLMSGHNISVRGSGSKGRVSASLLCSLC